MALRVHSPGMSQQGIGSYGTFGDALPTQLWDQQPNLAPSSSEPASAAMVQMNQLPAPQAPMQQFSPEQFEQVSQQQEAAPQFRSDLPPAVAVLSSGSSPGLPALSGLSGPASLSSFQGSTMLGPAVLAVGSGTLIGAAKGGVFGALAGALYGGSAINAVRAFRSAKTDRAEAVISGTFAIVGAGVATWLLWKKNVKATVAKTEG